METIIVFMYTALIGTVLSAYTIRIQLNQKKIINRNQCAVCNKKIGIVGRISLTRYVRGASICRGCNSSLKRKKLFIGLSTATLSVFIYLEYGFSLESAFFMMLLYCLIVIVIIDYNRLEMPNHIIWSLIVLCSMFATYDLVMNFNTISSHVMGMIIIGFPILLLATFGKSPIGLDAAKILMATGFFLGTQFVLVAAAITIILVGVVQVWIGNHDLFVKIPFSSYISVGVYVSILYGNEILLFFNRCV